MPNSVICLSFDFDALSVWFSFPKVTPARLHRGEYGARVGVPRMLTLLRQYGIPATFFIPGHTIDSFPQPVESILAAGHEVAHHSYAHEDPSQQSPDEERRDMERALRTLERIGVGPLGYRSPSADLSGATLSLIEEFGFLYDSSLMADDFQPYRPRLGDQVTQQSPLVKGREARFWEIPISFELDDWPHFQFSFNLFRNGVSAPGTVLEIWATEFDWMHTHLDGGVLTLTMHPQVIGRAHRLMVLERFIQHCQTHADVVFRRLGDVARRLGQDAATA